MQAQDNPQFQSAENLNHSRTIDNHSSSREIRCRICLDKEPGLLVQLPCACVGETGILHQECFERWIYTIKNQAFFHSRSPRSNSHEPNVWEIPCEICTNVIKFKVEERLTLISCKSQTPTSVLFLAIRILICLALIAVAAYIFGGGIGRSTSTLQISVNAVILVISEVVLLIILKLQFQSLFERHLSDLIILDAKQVKIKENSIELQEVEFQKTVQP